MEKEIKLLSEPLREWVKARGWRSLRPIQKMAIKEILSNSFVKKDFILSATTASGKTEAAFLPLLTAIHQSNPEPKPSFEILYISPLKALINDMSDRVSNLAQCVNRKSFRRHGEIKGKERHGAEGILLTTPESLEARFIRSPHKIASIFKYLQFVIIDEIHAYFQSPRGPQLISLITRLEALLSENNNKSDHMIRRIALSATVSNLSVEDVKTFLRPEVPGRVEILCPEKKMGKKPIEIHLKAFRSEQNRVRESPGQSAPLQQLYTEAHEDKYDVLDPPHVIKDMAHCLFDVFSNLRKGLIFTNSRREAEEFSELLNRRAREKGYVYPTEEFEKLLKSAKEKRLVSILDKSSKLLKLAEKKGLIYTPEEFAKVLKSDGEKDIEKVSKKLPELTGGAEQKNFLYTPEEFIELLKQTMEKNPTCTPKEFAVLLKRIHTKKTLVYTIEEFGKLLNLAREENHLYTVEEFAKLLNLASEKNRLYTIKELREQLEHINRKQGFVFTAREFVQLLTLVEEESQLKNLEELPELLNRLAEKNGFVQSPSEFKEKPNKKGKRPIDLEYGFLPATRLFWPHHGSLDSWMRSRSEKAMRDQEVKSILVCTSTLELGIDIGTVEATAQIGPGYSVASLRQRLGRSGRREGKNPVLHAYVRESDLGEDAHPVEKLHLQTFRTLAQINLLEAGVFELPDMKVLNLSTLIQQVLSYVHQFHGCENGSKPEEAQMLFVERGPFREAEKILEPLIKHLSIKHNALLEDRNGRLFLTQQGNKYVNHFTFYAAFVTPIEYVVQAGARRVGSFAPRYPYGPGDQFLLGGAYWKVMRVDHVRRIMHVTRASSGRAPYFGGDALAPSEPIVQEMERLYKSDSFLNPPFKGLPHYTNKTALAVIEEGANAYREIQRYENYLHIIPHGRDVILFPWVGTNKQITLICALKWMGLSCSAMDVAIYVRDKSCDEVIQLLENLNKNPLPTEHDLARYASKLVFEKHDYLLSPVLKRMNFASAKLDIDSLHDTIQRLEEKNT